jgi:hypothetical protein
MPKIKSNKKRNKKSKRNKRKSTKKNYKLQYGGSFTDGFKKSNDINIFHNNIMKFLNIIKTGKLDMIKILNIKDNESMKNQLSFDKPIKSVYKRAQLLFHPNYRKVQKHIVRLFDRF